MHQLFPLAKKSYPSIKFVGDVFISAAIVAALSAVAWGAIGALDQHGGVFWLMVPGVLVLLEGLLAAPLMAVPVYGVVKGRFGFVLGPIFLVAIIYGLSSLIVKQKEDIFTKLTSHTAAPVRMDHTLLAVEDDQNGSLCDEACIKVLATSNHTVALRGNTHRDRAWMLYTQADGPACFVKENAKLALEFLLRGFPGKCATRKPIPDFEDGLSLRAVWSDARRRPSPDLPEGFTGTTYEYFERLDGHDRLLGRHIKGGLAPSMQSLLMFEKRLPPIDAGPPIDTMSFLANSVGSDVVALRKPADPFPFDDVLTEIEKYLDQKQAIGAETFRYARWAWLQIAANASGPQPQLLKERILRLLGSRDPFRTELGIEAIFFMRLDERTFPDDVMLDLMFVPLADEASSHLQQHLERQFASGRSPPSSEVRERAKAHLNDPDLAPWKLRLLEQISEL